MKVGIETAGLWSMFIVCLLNKWSSKSRSWYSTEC